MKYYHKCLIFVFTMAALFVVPAGAATLDDLVSQALAANPEVKASAARWEMFTHKARQAGSFDDPMLMLGIDNGLVREPFDFKRDMQHVQGDRHQPDGAVLRQARPGPRGGHA